MGSELLSTRDQEILLRNAHRMLRRTAQYRNTVLWVFVSDITAFGATYSDQVCRELGWNPNALVCDDLPPRTAQETPAVPPGHFWRGEPESNRHQCRNCGEHYDKHLHTDEASRCPTGGCPECKAPAGSHHAFCDRLQV